MWEPSPWPIYSHNKRGWSWKKLNKKPKPCKVWCKACWNLPPCSPGRRFVPKKLVIIHCRKRHSLDIEDTNIDKTGGKAGLRFAKGIGGSDWRCGVARGGMETKIHASLVVTKQIASRRIAELLMQALVAEEGADKAKQPRRVRRDSILSYIQYSRESNRKSRKRKYECRVFHKGYM